MADLIAMLGAAAGAAAGGGEVDPNFNQTVLLLHGDGTNGAQNNTFLDSSTNNFTITRNGNTTQGTFSPFSAPDGRWSNYFDGTGDYFTVPYSTTNFDWFTSGTDFTFEAWIYPTTFTGWSYNAGAGDFGTVIGNVTPTSSTNYWSFGPIPNGTVRFFYFNGGTVTVTSTETCVLNQWNHIAFTKTSSGITIFVNGVGTTASAISGTPQSSTGVTLTIGSGNSSSINGYVSNLRIVKGSAVYSGTTYAVPTAPLTAITNTKLLISQSNRFVDNSSVANAITIAGNPSVQLFSPFAPTAAYDPAVNGGSGYFDGSGDYLQVPAGAFAFSTGDYTVECFVYLNALPSVYYELYDARSGATPTDHFLQITSSGFIRYRNDGVTTTTTEAISAGEWVHIAQARSGTTLKTFVNGVEVASTSSTSNLSIGSAVEIGGSANDNNYYLNGYISNFRTVIGTALYTSAFNPPTAPLTAVSGTELLLNFTNAGIFDNTGKNNLETVGNVQINTTTKKFGTGSMEFDGTGDYLILPVDPIQDLRTGDFTIEAWIYITAAASGFVIVCKGSGIGADLNNEWQFEANSSRNIVFTANATSPVVTSTGTVSLNTWSHVAASRSGTTLKLFINGVEDGSGTVSDDLFGDVMKIGTNRNISYYANGFIDDLRITKGVARYTTGFTPPTKAFPDL